MPDFHWTGKTANGQDVSGKMKAASKEEVVRFLQAQKITIRSITEKNPKDVTTSLESSSTQKSDKTLGRIVFIVLLVLAICMCIGLIRKFIG